jgi:hypothetical protein
MVTGIQITRTALGNFDYRKYEVDCRGCNLEIGDPVGQETIIGWHYRTGLPVEAGLNGQVATIHFNPMHDSLMILVVSRDK